MEQERISNLIKESEQTIQHHKHIIARHSKHLKELGYIVLPPCAECGRTLFVRLSSVYLSSQRITQVQVRCECGRNYTVFEEEEQ